MNVVMPKVEIDRRGVIEWRDCSPSKTTTGVTKTQINRIGFSLAYDAVWTQLTDGTCYCYHGATWHHAINAFYSLSPDRYVERMLEGKYVKTQMGDLYGLVEPAKPTGTTGSG